MAQVLYRVVSACGLLGSRFPRDSMQLAIRDGIDAIVCDCGSMDEGPFYLGAGQAFFEREAVKADYAQIVEAALVADVPVILGNCGTAGAERNLDWMLDIAREVFREQAVRNARVAVISSEVDSALVTTEYRRGALRATGRGPELDEVALRSSVIVGQMGVHPLMRALEGGAKYIFAGRCCGASLFAADMIRRGVAAGLAYHAGHILKRGAEACEPASMADCLVCEITDDGCAVFQAPAATRRCTVNSLAARSLQGNGHPHVHHFPEGALVTEESRFFAVDARRAGMRGSRFVNVRPDRRIGIKLEGAHRVGSRRVSLVRVAARDLERIPLELPTYGRNGVQRDPACVGEVDLGLFVEATSAIRADAERLARVVSEQLFKERRRAGDKTAMADLAHPFSPRTLTFERSDGTFGAVVPGGTRHGLVAKHLQSILASVHLSIETCFPETLASASYCVHQASADQPVVVLTTTDSDSQHLSLRHSAELAQLPAPPLPGSWLEIDVPEAYEWSLCHVIEDEALITSRLFNVDWYCARGARWIPLGTGSPPYSRVIADSNCKNLDDRLVSLIAEARPHAVLPDTRTLSDLASLIRSSNADVNRLTFDILFDSDENYEQALASNQFHLERIAEVLRIDPGSIIGSYFADNCRAIKITVDRTPLSAAANERDVSGTQQQARLEAMDVPGFWGSHSVG